MIDTNQIRVRQLMEKGVCIPAPQSVEIGEEVDPKRISGDGVTLRAGSRIYGSKTWISRDVRIGIEAPATVDNCQIGPRVVLSGGYFKEAVFLAGASMGSGAQVRQGTILEEEARGAHTVALKQTILFPFVTLGSLINFCDVFMAGGTDRQNHSEVGSSFIHFNYTPNQDKATASLLGDVPAGVMLNQRPIFLGGQGGLVGPCRLAYGTVLAAGAVWRKDELRPGRLLFGDARKAGSVPYKAGVVAGFQRVVDNNLVYIANLAALMQWYRQVRTLFIGNDFPDALLTGLQEKVAMAIDERIRRLAFFCRTVADRDQGGASDSAGARVVRQWPAVEEVLRSAACEAAATGERDRFLKRLEAVSAHPEDPYLKVIQSLPAQTAAEGTAWLNNIIINIINKVNNI